MKRLIVRGICFALLWEALALLAPQAARMPHIWQFGDAVASFARFSDTPGPSLIQGLLVLAKATLVSLLRALGGFLLGLSLAFLSGIGSLMVPGWQAVPAKATAYLRAIPPLSLIFLFSYLSPEANVAAVAYVAISFALLLAGGLHETSRYLPGPLLYHVEALGGGRVRQLCDVALPEMWLQTRAMSLWACSLLMPFTFGAELISSQSGGLGMLAFQGFLYANLAQLMVLATIYMLVGHALTYSIRRLFSLDQSTITPNPNYP